MKHTPGPWEIIKTHDGTIENSSVSAAIYYRDKSTVEGLGSIRICGLNTCNPHAGENEANARLIAAAPNMFDLLQTLDAYFREYRDGGLSGYERDLAGQVSALLSRIK
jgi:hypothetical protein